jgi:hypothetical protein
MKLIVSALSVLLAKEAIANGCNGRKKRSYGICNGVEYLHCAGVCCGGTLKMYANGYGNASEDEHCCGNEWDGTFYNSRTELCCNGGKAWDSNGDGNLDTKHIVFSDQWGDKQCCHNGTNVPALFDVYTEMCCEGEVQWGGDTGYTSCCDNFSFDRRWFTCPCNDGQLLNIPDGEGACCHRANMHWASQYDTGTAYDPHTDLCCADGGVGSMDDHICCGDKLIQYNGTSTGAPMYLECCETRRGGHVVIDSETEFCCGYEAKARTKDWPIEQCCETSYGVFQVYDSTTDVCCEGMMNTTVGRGDECCGGDAMNSKWQLCCDGTVHDQYTGAAMTLTFDCCCRDEPFLAADQICCNDTISTNVDANGDEVNSCCHETPFNANTHSCCDDRPQGPFDWPSCCDDIGFDSKLQTCCDNMLMNNPVNANNVTSTTNRCCQDPITFVWSVYNYEQGACCGEHHINQVGTLIDLTGLSKNGFCCGDTFAGEDFMCCEWMGVFTAVTAHAGWNTKCCGGETTYNPNTHFCCNEVNGTVIATTDDQNACCGDVGYDVDEMICCDGDELRPLNGVPAMHATCCDNACVDTRDYWCCGGQIYSKGDHSYNTNLVACPHENTTLAGQCTCAWNTWSSCSATCGNSTGIQSRRKSDCTNSVSGGDCSSAADYNQYGVQSCPGPGTAC